MSPIVYLVCRRGHAVPNSQSSRMCRECIELDLAARRERELRLLKAVKERRKAALAQAGQPDYDIPAILAKQHGKCVGCQSDIRQRYTIDHVIPLSRGGTNQKTNVQLMCSSCNSSKQSKTMEEWRYYVANRTAINAARQARNRANGRVRGRIRQHLSRLLHTPRLPAPSTG